MRQALLSIALACGAACGATPSSTASDPSERERAPEDDRVADPSSGAARDGVVSPPSSAAEHCVQAPTGPPPAALSVRRLPAHEDWPAALPQLGGPRWGEGVHDHASLPDGSTVVLWQCAAAHREPQCQNQGPGMPGCDPVPEIGPVCRGAPGLHLERFDARGRSRSDTLLGGSGFAAFGGALATAAGGDLFVAGYFRGQLATSAGAIESTAGWSVLVARVSGARRVGWIRRLPGPSSAPYSTGVVLAPTADGGVALGAQAASSAETHNDAMVARLASDGTERYRFVAGGPGDRDDVADLEPLADGSLLVAGVMEAEERSATCATPSRQSDAWIARLDPTGGLVWSVRAGGGGHDFAHAVLPLSDGGAWALGTTTPPTEGLDATGPVLFAIDPSGHLAWARRVCDWFPSATGVVEARADGATLTGRCLAYGPRYEAFVLDPAGPPVADPPAP